MVLKEEEIRPEKIFDKYLALMQDDISTIFKDCLLEDICCPAHSHEEGKFKFKKNSFSFRECEICSSLFVSPRPANSCFEKFYLEGQSVEYWSTQFYKQTQEARRVKLWQPKCLSLSHYIKKKFPDKTPKIYDIGGGYGLFAEEIRNLGYNVTVIEPNLKLAQSCTNKNIDVINKFTADVLPSEIDSGPNVFTSFELLEHLTDVQGFISSVRNLMKPKDLIYMTTLSPLGLDISLLQKFSKAVSPPQHINFMSPMGMTDILSHLDFTNIEISTPGQLDVDILCKNSNYISSTFFQTIISKLTEAEKSSVQNWLSNNLLSSHMLVIGEAN